ncbi:hypothetical protein GW750_02870 [bacterium]|nr:hypothetical protein [bacterium]
MSLQVAKSNFEVKYGVSCRHRSSCAERVNPTPHEKYGKIATVFAYVST